MRLSALLLVLLISALSSSLQATSFDKIDQPNWLDNAAPQLLLELPSTDVEGDEPSLIPIDYSSSSILKTANAALYWPYFKPSNTSNTQQARAPPIVFS
ncbi:hypothetical protein [Marinomonas epiphytica]